MSEPLKVFDRLEDLTPTELWSAIEHRQAGPDPDPPVSRSRRITVIGVAFAIAAVAIVLPVVAIVRAQEPAPLDQGASRHGVARSPMGLPIVVTFPPDWYAENVSQPASLDPAVDSGTQVGIVMSTSQEAMPPALTETATSESAGALPDDPNLPASFVTVTILAIEDQFSTGMDSGLPLSMDDAQIAPGIGNIRILDAQIGRVPLTITVQGGLQASDADLAAAEGIVSSIRPAEGQGASSEQVVVPELVGLPISEAVELATNAGLTVETIKVLDDSKLGEPGADDVLSQIPFAGTEVEKGASISVTVTAMPHSQRSPTVDERRVGVYEAMIRELVDPAANGEIIYVNRKLCSYLGGRGDDVGGCSDRIDPAEQAVLADRLGDLGQVEFVDDLGDAGRDETPVTLLGPIIDSPDGLRVEGGYWCGPLCAGGQMYIVEPVGAEYEVTGTDHSYGSWIS